MPPAQVTGDSASGVFRQRAKPWTRIQPRKRTTPSKDVQTAKRIGQILTIFAWIFFAYSLYQFLQGDRTQLSNVLLALVVAVPNSVDALTGFRERVSAGVYAAVNLAFALAMLAIWWWMR